MSLAQLVAVPAVRAAGGQRAAERVPQPRLVVAEHLQLAVGIFTEPVERHGDVARRANHHAQRTGAHQPRAGRLDHGVAAAKVDRQPLGQSRLVRRRARHAPGQLGGLVRRRKDRAVQPGQRDQRLVPPARARVEESGAGGVGDVGGDLAGQAEADVVLRTAKYRHPGEVLRLLIAQPEDLAAGIASEHPVVRVRKQAGQSAGALGDPIALLLRALVAPEHGRADDAQVAVERHQPVHLSGKAQSGDGGPVDRRAGQNRAQAAHDAAVPVGGILLRPAGARRGEGVFLRGRCEHGAGFVHGDALRAGGSDVEADQQLLAHGGTPQIDYFLCLRRGRCIYLREIWPIFPKSSRFSSPRSRRRMLARWQKNDKSTIATAKERYSGRFAPSGR